MRISRTKDRIIVKCEGSGADFDAELRLLHSIPTGVFNKREKYWEFPYASCVELVTKIPANMLTEVSAGAQTLIAIEQQNISDLRHMLDMDWKGSHDFLMGHQNLSVHIARLYDRFAFFLDTGTGKTITGLHIISENMHLKWLIIPPKSTIRPAWLQDCVDFYPGIRIMPLSNNFKKLDYKEILDGWGIKYTPYMKKSDLFELGCKNCNAFIVNSEAFAKFVPLLNTHGVSGAIFDESVKLKSVSAQITKSFTAYANKHLQKVYLLSGKPAPNGEQDYFSQMRIVEPAVFGERVTHFKTAYFEPVGMFDIRLRRDKIDEFAERLSTRSIIVSKQDCLDLPPETFTARSLPFDPKSAELYAQMSSEFLICVEDKEYKAVNAGVLRGKLRQITSGFIYGEEGMLRLHNHKLTMLDELLEELVDEPVIVWVAFRQDIHAIVEHLEKKNISCVTAYSETKDLDASVKAFMNNEARVIVAHPGSIKFGITFCGRNMVRNCTNAVYYSFTENYDDFYQSKDRIYRKGQTEKVTHHFLMMEKTVDQLTYKTLVKKGEGQTFMEELIKQAKAVVESWNTD